MSEPNSETADAWLAAAKDAERRGELLEAYDIAERGLAAHPDSLWLKHRAVLVLARANATEQAARRFRDYGLGGETAEDIAALEARIAKDRALAVTGDERQRRARHSAEIYRAIFDRTGSYYPGINAATMTLIAGDARGAAALAGEVATIAKAGRDDPYYRAATAAEAALLQDDAVNARAAVAEAVAAASGDWAAIATTRKQLGLIVAIKGLPADVLAPLAAPSVVHYCGHMIAAPGRSGRFPAAAERAVADRIAREFSERHVGFGYGSLASGGDILAAEALIVRGAELHVVLPFAAEEFVATSVAAGGPGWVERFRVCLARARSVHYATEDAYLGDDLLFRYAAEMAMGLALLRARYLDTAIAQLAVWDGRPNDAPAGTAVDVAAWRARGLPSIAIAPDRGATPPSAPARSAPAAGRTIRAMLFGDVKGFSKLKDAELPRFVEHVLGRFARVLARFGADIRFRNTWGDGLFVVLPTPAIAAACALELQTSLADIDYAAVGLPNYLALRLGGHVGPVYETRDPILGVENYFGAHVSRTARIEPVTPPGSVYVTEPFAAAIALERDSGFACDYVGHMPAAKGYGNFRMYLLRATR